MSITVEYYFRSSLPLPELAAQIAAPLGCHLPLENALLLGTRLTLGRCTEENDGELAFEAYNYELVLRTRGRHFRATLIPNMLSVVRVLQELFGYSGMLVYDLAILLAKYDEEFVDTLSGTSLSDYMAHLTAVRYRMPEGSP
ncbi:hypothetical protein [Actinophytocola sp. NPDC049390]|uniref:hypothetical protein n=1 Tax=Actinophytocola sp. NPDC049390 TaxID=3363894 RepID=UPI0037ABC86F